MMMIRRQAVAAAARCRSTTTTSTSRCHVLPRSLQTLAVAAAPPSSALPLLLSSSYSSSISSSTPRCRYFSSSSTAASDALLDLLTREHAEEVQNSQEASANSSELQELHDELVATQGWKIISDRAMTRMMKTITTSTTSGNNKRLKIQVTFHCQDMVQEVQEQDQEEEEPLEVEEEEEEEAASPVRFTVTITNPSAGGANNTMVLTCLSENATMQIQSVAMTSNNTSGSSSSDSVDDILPASADYQGPEFGELAQDLQDAFYTFCQETCGINDDVVAFVAMQADFKEQTCYVEFLQDASNLLK